MVAGCCELLGVENRVDVRVGTLGKALGCFGGFVAGSKSLINWIYNKARPYVFSTAQPEIISAAAIAALKMVRVQPDRRLELLERAKQLGQQLVSLGFDIGSSESQIIPIMVGAAPNAIRCSKRLMECGIYVPCIRPPYCRER